MWQWFIAMINKLLPTVLDTPKSKATTPTDYRIEAIKYLGLGVTFIVIGIVLLFHRPPPPRGR
jgi:hypothetical protein